MSALNKRVADLLAEHRRMKEEQKALRGRMLEVAVEHLGVDQKEAMQMNLEPLFDGFLLGQGVMQKWRRPEGEETASAFPLAEPGDCVSASEGMSLRDHFATHCGELGDEVSMVLAAELAATQGVAMPTDSKDLMGRHRFWCAVHAAHSYMMADAMLAARKRSPNQ